MMVDSMTHLKYDILLNYLEDRLPAQERSQVEAHLAEPCWRCGRHLALLRTVLDSVTGDRTVAPPPAVLKRAVDIGRSQRKIPKPSPWMRVVAALSFDNRLQLSSAATRGATRVRQMLFTTEQVDIDLQIKPGVRDKDLLGQLLGTQSTGEVLPAFVSLQNNKGAVLRATETDSRGQFAFRQVPFGVYDLVFDLENQEVAVTGLELEND
jgi:hypothetical protein